MPQPSSTDSARTPFDGPAHLTEQARGAPLDGHPPAASHSPDGGVHTNGAARDLDLIELLVALQAMRVGNFSVRLPSHHTGLGGKVADAFNDIVAANERIAEQLERVGQVVGR